MPLGADRRLRFAKSLGRTQEYQVRHCQITSLETHGIQC